MPKENIINQLVVNYDRHEYGGVSGATEKQLLNIGIYFSSDNSSKVLVIKGYIRYDLQVLIHCLYDYYDRAFEAARNSSKQVGEMLLIYDISGDRLVSIKSDFSINSQVEEILEMYKKFYRELRADDSLQLLIFLPCCTIEYKKFMQC